MAENGVDIHMQCHRQIHQPGTTTDSSLGKSYDKKLKLEVMEQLRLLIPEQDYFELFRICRQRGYIKGEPS